jgi:hypothetical protein
MFGPQSARAVNAAKGQGPKAARSVAHAELCLREEHGHIGACKSIELRENVLHFTFECGLPLSVNLFSDHGRILYFCDDFSKFLAEHDKAVVSCLLARNFEINSLDRDAGYRVPEILIDPGAFQFRHSQKSRLQNARI